jgi:hypothetical protein
VVKPGRSHACRVIRRRASSGPVPRAPEAFSEVLTDLCQSHIKASYDAADIFQAGNAGSIPVTRSTAKRHPQA